MELQCTLQTAFLVAGGSKPRLFKGTLALLYFTFIYIPIHTTHATATRAPNSHFKEALELLSHSVPYNSKHRRSLTHQSRLIHSE